MPAFSRILRDRAVRLVADFKEVFRLERVVYFDILQGRLGCSCTSSVEWAHVLLYTTYYDERILKILARATCSIGRVIRHGAEGRSHA